MADFVNSAIIMASAANTVCASLTFSNYLSQPILSLGDSKLLVTFLIGRGEVLNAEDGYCMWPPSLLAVFNVHNGSFEELRAVTSTEFFRSDDPEQPIFSGASPAEKSAVEFLEKQVRLFESFDQLVVRLIARSSYQNELMLYDDNFKKLSEAALVPYYDKLLLKPIT